MKNATRRTTLLTGFPSFLARRMLATLNAKPQRHVTLLVQEKFVADAEQARAELQSPERVSLIVGDVVKIDFGLSGAEFRSLVAELDAFFHFASNGFFGESRKRLFEVNVNGTVHALDIACEAPHLRRFVHLSSVFVAGRREGPVFENELRNDAGFFNAVEESRFRAEQKVRALVGRLPILVVRPGFVVGDSVTGEIDRLSGPYLLLRSIVHPLFDLPTLMPGEGQAPLQLVPVDFVVEAITVLAEHPTAPGKTYHIVDPHALPARRVVELVAAHADRQAPLVRMPTVLARSLSRLPGFERFLGERRAILEYCNAKATFDSTDADVILRERGIECPPFESYVNKMTAFVVSRLEPAETGDDVRDPLL